MKLTITISDERAKKLSQVIAFRDPQPTVEEYAETEVGYAIDQDFAKLDTASRATLVEKIGKLSDADKAEVLAVIEGKTGNADAGAAELAKP